jgi:hypothetical protein
MILVDAVREASASLTAELYNLVGCVYNAEEAEKIQLGLTKYLLETASQVMVNNYNRFADGRSLFYLSHSNCQDEVTAYERNIPSDIEDDYEDDDDDDEDDEDLEDTRLEDEAENDDDNDDDFETEDAN